MHTLQLAHKNLKHKLTRQLEELRVEWVIGLTNINSKARFISDILPKPVQKIDIAQKPEIEKHETMQMKVRRRLAMGDRSPEDTNVDQITSDRPSFWGTVYDGIGHIADDIDPDFDDQ